MSRAPEPRPALQKAPDGSMHPAAPRTAAAKHLHPAPQAPATPPPAHGDFRPGDLRARKAAGRKPEKTKKSERVSVEVQLPKKLRKEAKHKAAESGWTLDEAITYVLRAWVDS